MVVPTYLPSSLFLRRPFSSLILSEYEALTDSMA
jgi:hypothetical protein